MSNPLPTTPDGLVLTRDAEAIGLRETLLTARHAARLLPLRRGVYVSAEDAAAMGPVAGYRAMTLAVGLQRRAPVFAGFSAAVLWGLPVVGTVPDEVYLLARGPSGRRRNGVVEFAHRDAVGIDVQDGLLLTSLPDALLDVARTFPLATALVMVDAALRINRFDAVPPRVTPEELAAAFERRLPFPGSARVRAVFDRGTSLAESPLETVSRVQIEGLGFPAPVLQHPVRLPRSGRTVFLDMAWPEYGVWGEADGDGKYLGNAVSAGDRRSPASIVLEEKKRENAVRAATRWTPTRWDWTEANRAQLLRAILLEAGLPITRRARRLR
ncbi:hypothetical protein [Microterricola pindariensis]|uniref:hypothetical protein n=1 Tax=Microterricola pindariensis TaxID=478010 RepID=UPI000CEC5405|nr:hypothetical protein [Microterricola pindariensis]